MKQRLALSVALLNNPPLLVLDEPTSNLDSAGRESLMQLLLELKAAGKSILFISHRPEEVAGLADRVLTLEGGRVLTDIATRRSHVATVPTSTGLDEDDGFVATAAPAAMSLAGIRRFA
jgi:ABC-type multidrug transport system ATPase subunit